MEMDNVVELGKTQVKVSGNLIFRSWDEAVAAGRALSRAGFGFVIMPERIDRGCAATTFAECFRTIDYNAVDACMEQVQAIVDPYRGECDEFGRV
jgi:hypothetical protein